MMLKICMTLCRGGTAAKRAPSPRPVAITITVKPTKIPQICGKVRRNPKFAPDAASIRLFGPGVIATTATNRARPAKVVKSITGNIRKQEVADAISVSWDVW